MGGTGKSTIAKTVAGKLDDSEEKEYSRILAGTYFCSRQSGDTRNLFHIIPTISHQLARRVRSYARALLDADVIDFATTTNLKLQIQKLLVEPWLKSAEKRAKLGSSYLVVIDALDEIENDGGPVFLQTLLETIENRHLQGLKFLVTSRPHPQLVKSGNSLPQDAVFHLEEVRRNEAERDIETFLRDNLPALKDDSRIGAIAQRASGLFIFAATAVRYISNPPGRTLREQTTALDRLLQHWPAGQALEIDELYQQILVSALSKHDADDLRYRLKIVHIILCAAEPLSVSNIVDLCDLDPETVQAVVDSLHATLYISQSDYRIYWHHATFQDFFFHENRSSNVKASNSTELLDVFCNQSTTHTFLAERCFETMQALRFNICELPSSFLLDREVQDLESRVKKNINEALRYSCRHWGRHLERANSEDSRSKLIPLLVQFLDEKLLFWIEVMNLILSKGRSISQLRDVLRWLKKVCNAATTYALLMYTRNSNRIIRIVYRTFWMRSVSSRDSVEHQHQRVRPTCTSLH
jgi:hypothetical protein